MSDIQIEEKPNVRGKIKTYREELEHMQNEHKLEYQIKAKQLNEIILTESKYTALCRVHQELTKKMSDMEEERQNELANFAIEKDIAETQNLNLAQELNNLTDKFIKLNQELEKQKQINENAQKEIEELKFKWKERGRLINLYEKNRFQDKTKKQADQMMIENLKRMVSDLNATTMELRNLNNSNKLEIEKSGVLLNKANIENMNLSAHLHSLEKQLEIIKKDNSETKQELAAVNSQCTNAKNRVDLLESEKKDIQQENIKLKSRLETAEKSIVLDKQLMQRQNQEMINTGQKLESIQIENTQMKHELVTLNEKLDSMQTELESTRKSINIDKQLVLLKNQELVAEKSQNLSLVKKNSSLECEISYLKQDKVNISRMERCLNEEKLDKAKLLDQVNSLKKQLESLQNVLSTNRTDYEASLIEMQQIQKKLSDDNLKAMSLKNQEIDEMRKSILTFRKKVNILEREINAIVNLNVSIASLEEKIMATRTLNAQQTEEVNKLNEERLKHFDKIACNLLKEACIKRKHVEIKEANREERKSSKKVSK